MLHIALCDDDTVFSDMLKQKISEYFSCTGYDISVYTFHSAETLLACGHKFSLYLLDIMLPGNSGLDAAGKLREMNPDSAIIFISSMETAVFESIHYAPLRFIRKEKLPEELPEALDAFCDFYQRCGNTPSVLLKTGEGDITISIHDILYLESVGHYLLVHCRDRIYKIRGLISHYEKEFSPYYFLRAAHGFLINPQAIARVSGDLLLINNSVQIKMTRTYKPSFLAAYSKYQREVLHAISISTD